MTTTKETVTDHDILVELKATTAQNFQTLRDDIQRLTDGTHAQLNDHEIRIRKIESNYVTDEVYSPAHMALIKSIDSVKKIIYMAMGMWILLTTLVGLYTKLKK